MNKLRMESMDMVDENVKKIGDLFPNCITETKDAQGRLKRSIKWDVLKETLSGEYVEGGERYEFMWPGKKAAYAEAMRSIRKTLRPCKEESKNWDSTENLYIEGDNLEVLKLLQESYLGKVKMIYIDPPYNTGHDFVYRDNFQRSQQEENTQLGLFDEDESMLFENTESNGRFHSDWCSMIYSRLMLARNLLSDDGVIFVSIDDGELNNLKKLCDEVFGEENSQGILIWKTKTAAKGVPTKNMLVTNHDYVLVYSKSLFRFRGENRDMSSFYNPDNDPRGLWKADNMKSTVSSNCFEIIDPSTGNRYLKNWAFSKETIDTMIREKKIIWPKDPSGTPRQKRFLSEMTNETTPLRSLIGDFQSETATNKLKELFGGNKVFSFPKSVELLRLLIQQGTSNSDICVDFFSGSATTAHAVMQLNAEDGGHRKFIMVQLPEKCDEKSEAFKAGYKNICEIGKERIRRAGEKIVAELKAKQAKEAVPSLFSTTEHTERLTPPQNTKKGTGDSSVCSVSAEGGFSDFSGQNAPVQNLPDIGFRVLKVADSNMKDVYYAAGDYTQDLLTQTESNIKEDRTDLDLLFGCLLDWGLPLSCPYTSEKIEGGTVHTYNDGDLIACFDANIPESVVKEIAKRKPLRAVFRDSSFASSPAKINVFEIFKLYAPDTSVKVI